jgi:hypothetical protein
MLAGMTFSPRDEVPVVSKFFDRESPGAGLFNESNSSTLTSNLHEGGQIYDPHPERSSVPKHNVTVFKRTASHRKEDEGNAKDDYGEDIE